MEIWPVDDSAEQSAESTPLIDRARVAATVVLDESSEHEPEEPDPGAAAEDVEFDATSGEELAQNVESDAGDALVETLPESSEIAPDVKRTFWFLVILVKFALIAVSFGLLTAYFWGWRTRGGLLVFAGCLALLDVAVRARRFSTD